MRNFVLVVLLCVFVGSASAQASRPTSSPGPLRIAVDPRIELFSMIFRFAGHPEYNRSRHYAYVEAVEKWFEGAVRHPVVQMAMELRRRSGVSYDAVPALAIHLDDAANLNLRMPLDPWPAGLDKRWTEKDVEKFLRLARDFSKEYRFGEFFASQRSFYAIVEGRMEKLLAQRDNVAWIEAFFGERHGAKFNVCIGLLNGGNNFGPHVEFADGTSDLFQIIGVWNFDDENLPTFPESIVPIIVHEFCHSYVNHLVDRHEKELEASGKFIFDRVRERMEKQAYGNWKTMIYESVVRACVCRYVKKFDGEEGYKKQIEDERSRAFFWTRDLAACLGNYEANRSKYPTFSSYMPEIVRLFDRYVEAVKAQAESSPSRR